MSTHNLPDAVDLAWASFPCQDLSLAGSGAGLKGKRSGTFWSFWKLIRQLKDEERAPKLVVLENVCGALSSHNGEDFAAIGDALAEANYKFGAVVIDAVDFLPQSRPRLFIVGARNELEIPDNLFQFCPDDKWHPNRLISTYAKLSERAVENWVWWRLPTPPKRKLTFTELIEENPAGVKWHTPAETKKLLDMMTSINLQKVEMAKQTGKRTVGGIYKRTRLDEFGCKAQRTEVRFDDLAGCLRTPAGGSSRQIILIIEGEHVSSRLLSPREAARLMGLPEKYILPVNYNEAYHLAGDGVVVPVVRYLAEHILEPLLTAFEQASERKAA